MEQQKMRVDAIRATDCAVVSDKNGVVLIFTRPVYSPGSLDEKQEMVPSASVWVPWNLATEIARIVMEKSKQPTIVAEPETANGKVVLQH